MSFSYDVSSDVGKIRLWIRDTDSTSALYTDEEISAMFAMNENDIRLTAAALLIALAGNKALLAKAVSAGKYSEDSRRGVAFELRETAKAIIEGGQIPADGVIEQTFENPINNRRRLNDPGAQEFIEKEYIRTEGDIV